MAGGTMRNGADVGGTFTDVVLETGAGMFSTKVLTTYDAPERGILDGVATVVAEAEPTWRTWTRSSTVRPWPPTP